MTELEKDLEMIDAEAAEFLLDSYPGRYVQHIAARLAEMGYVKVVRCGECERWGGNHEHVKECSVCAGWLEKGEGLCYGHYIEVQDMGTMKATDFCPYGVRLVAKSATTETSVPAPEKAE